MALAVCLLFDAHSDHTIRRLWRRLENDGVPTLLTHTHGHHVPHLSYAVLRTFDLGKVADALDLLPDEGPMTLHFDAIGMFRRSRTWLVPSVTSDIARRQERLVEAVAVVLGEGLAEAREGAERRPEVVGDGVGKRLELLIRGGEFGRLPLRVDLHVAVERCERRLRLAERRHVLGDEHEGRGAGHAPGREALRAEPQRPRSEVREVDRHLHLLLRRVGVDQAGQGAAGDARRSATDAAERAEG